VSRPTQTTAPGDHKPVRRFGVLGQPWTLELLVIMHDRGQARFSDLLADLPGISNTLLSRRLKELVAAGFLERQILEASPPHSRYDITAAGQVVAAQCAALERVLPRVTA
jgi:DNA-binding HxlR family transcriptional regulator